jgi:UDPglucose 6-dehydrogenase
LLVITEWDEFRTLDLTRLRETMNHPIIVDGRNIFVPERVAQAGFEYYSMGRAVLKPETHSEQSAAADV